jgi:peptide/nickel transport system permease protein
VRFPRLGRGFRRVFSRAELVIGLVLVLTLAVVAIAAPAFAPPEDPEDPYTIPRDGFSGGPKPPSPEHLLGLMEGRYDMLYGLIWGTRVAFRVGLIITVGRALVGIVLGLISGFYGGWVDSLLMRITDAFMAFPIVAAVLVMLTVFVQEEWGIRLGKGDRVILVALTVFGWMQYARLIRGNVLAEREKEYVRAAVSIGASDRRLIFRHILPNATQGLFVLIASDIGAMVVTVAALTFIGLSGEEIRADWGMILKVSRNWVIGAPTSPFEYWYTYVPPILAILLFSVGWSLIGDGLRQALDPRLRGADRS